MPLLKPLPEIFFFSKTAGHLLPEPELPSGRGWGVGAEGDTCLAGPSAARRAGVEVRGPEGPLLIGSQCAAGRSRMGASYGEREREGKSPSGSIHSLPAISYPSHFSSFAVTRQEGALAHPLPRQRFQVHSSALCFPLIFPVVCSR